MSTPDLQSLNATHALPGAVSFMAGPGGLTVARVTAAQSAATVALLGAHVMDFQPRQASHPVLWMSRHSALEVGKPLRGGIPVCWPWFGKHPTDSTLPNHGLVRSRLWTVRQTRRLPDGSVRLVLGLDDSDETRRLWPFAFSLDLTVTVGAKLDVELRAHNPGPAPFTCTGALHTYLAVSDIRNTTVLGLEGGPYIDTVGDGWVTKKQDGPLAFTEETDRIFTGAAGDCVAVDPGWARRLRVAKRGSRTTVVWNPWIAKAKRMADFGDDEYPEMLCIEAANAADDRVVVAAGAEHRLGTTVSVE